MVPFREAWKSVGANPSGLFQVTKERKADDSLET